MGLFSKSAAARVVVVPGVARPRQKVSVTVTTDKPLTGVTAARLDWGYDNHYRYRWAGRADSAMAAAGEAAWLVGDVGTNAGGEKGTDDWISVTSVELPVPIGEFTGTSGSFTVPSWAPGSSKEFVRWCCRLIVERSGRDVDERGDFTVVVGIQDAAGAGAVDEPVKRINGDGETELEILLPTPVFRAGQTITGTIRLTPQIDMSDGELSLFWVCRRVSHPLERSPAASGGSASGDRQKLGKGIPLRRGSPVEIPFALAIPSDAPPTATAVHSSVGWYLEATLTYSKWTQGIEKVQKPFVVVNA